MEYAQPCNDGSRKVMCTKCNKILSTMSNFRVHITTKQHHNCNNSPSSTATSNKSYKCDMCNKIFAYHSGLWRHKKQCAEQASTQINLLKTTVENLKSEIETIKTTATNSTSLSQQQPIINNTFNNCHFNNMISIYLDKNCQSTTTIDDLFEKHLVPHMPDIMFLANNGHLKTVSNIMAKSCCKYMTDHRPIHCFGDITEPQNLQLRIKNHNQKWLSNEDSYEVLLDITESIERRLRSAFKKWETNPDYIKILSKAQFAQKMRDKLDDVHKILEHISSAIFVDIK